jgi:hypothetical protein
MDTYYGIFVKNELIAAAVSDDVYDLHDIGEKQTHDEWHIRKISYQDALMVSQGECSLVW